MNWDPILDALTNQNWWIVASIVLSLVVSLLRRWTLPWFSTQLGGWVLNFGLAALGGLGTLLAAGTVPTFQQLIAVIIDALKLGAGSALVYHAAKDSFGFSSKKRAAARA